MDTWELDFLKYPRGSLEVADNYCYLDDQISSGGLYSKSRVTKVRGG